MPGTIPNSDEPSGTNSQRKLVELNKLELGWHSILVGEDLLVAALLKSLRRNGIVIENPTFAYEAIRDVAGELINLARIRSKPNLAVEIEDLVVKPGDGSGGGGERTPETNP